MKKHSRINLNVLLLGIVSLLNDFSSEMIKPILPMFITALGGSSLIVGFIGGLRDSIASLLKVFSGYFSDKYGKKKRIVFSGYLTSAIFKLLLSFSTAWSHVAVFASLERIGKGLRTAPRDAIIAESMPKKRGEAFGFHRMMDTFGAILGSIVAFLLIWTFGLEYKTIILAAGIIALLSLVPLIFVKEKKHKPNKMRFMLTIRRLPKKLRLFILIATLFSFANISYMFFILKVKSTFTGKLSTGIPILLYVLFNAVYAGFSLPLGKLSDKIGREKILLFGYALFSITLLGFGFSSNLLSFIVLFVLYGLVYAAIDANQRAFVSDLSPTNLRATALGAFHTFVGLAALPANMIAGWLWQMHTEYTFLYASLVSLISFILMLTLFLPRWDKSYLLRSKA